MIGWPILRTDPTAAMGREVRIAINSAFWTWLGACLLGCVFMLVLFAGTSLLGENSSFARPLQGLGVLTMILIYSPIFSWAGFLLAVPLSIWSLRKGWAGWLSAIIAGTIVGGLVFIIIGKGEIEAFLIGVIFGAPFAAFYWLIACFLYPTVFVSK